MTSRFQKVSVKNTSRDEIAAANPLIKIIVLLIYKYGTATVQEIAKKSLLVIAPQQWITWDPNF
jgi:hypothetical protein